MLSYGNASQQGSKHLADQLPFMMQKRLHPVWRDRTEIETHLELAESIRWRPQWRARFAGSVPRSDP
jgi:hypothetical protein